MSSGAQGKFATDEKPDYTPRYRQDMAPGEKERATTRIGFASYFINNEGLDDIKVGRDVEKLWRLAKTHKSTWLAVKTVVAAAFWVPWDIMPQNDYDRNPEFEAWDELFKELILRSIRSQRHQRFDRWLQDIARHGKTCGFTSSELVPERWEGEALWNLQIKIKKPWDFNPKVDRADNVTALYHYPTGQDLHPDAFVFAPYGHFGANYLGTSDIEPIRHEILQLQKLEEVLTRIATNLSRRPVIDKYDAGSMDKLQQATHFREIDDTFNGKGNGVIHVPAYLDKDQKELIAQAELEYTENRTGPEALTALTEYILELKKEIQRGIGLPDDLGNTTVNYGSRAKTEGVFDLLIANAEDLQGWIEDTVNSQYIDRFIYYNYPAETLPAGYLCPRFEFSQIEEEYDLAKAQFVGMLIDKGLLKIEDLAEFNIGRKIAGLPVTGQETLDKADVDDVELNESGDADNSIFSAWKRITGKLFGN